MPEKPVALAAFGWDSIYQEFLCYDGSAIEDLIASFVKAKFAWT